MMATMTKKEAMIEEIKNNISSVISNRNSIIEIKEQLIKHGITGGRVESVFSNPDVLEDADVREVILLTEQFFLKTGILALNPESVFTINEIKEARQFYQPTYEEDVVTLPVVLNNVIMAGRNVYVTVIDAKTIAEWMKSQVLYYNPEIQREPTRRIRKDEVRTRPTVYRKNVDEIRELMLNEKLKLSSIAFNAAVGTSDTGDEFIYDSKNNTLTITEGTRLDILDGFHRSLASLEAYNKNPDVDFKFSLAISNYTTREAQQVQAQHAQQTPISKSRIQQLKADRHADSVMQYLMSDSELKDRVTLKHRPRQGVGELVTYNILADAIEREFPMERRVDAVDVSEYLGEFFDYLIGKNFDEFTNENLKRESLMSYNKMFAGYVALAAKMKKEKVKASKVGSIVEDIDFTRNNPDWKEIGILDNELRISPRSNEKKIANYFKKIKIN